MFPLIPALILLLLHGPSSFERLAESGRLPAALVALRREATVARPRTEIDREDASRRVLATLIAVSGDRALSEAFCAMFGPEGQAAKPTACPKPSRTQPVSPRIPSPPCRRLPDGFAKGQRSRDGPFDFGI